MKTVAEILSSGAQRSERASEPAGAPPPWKPEIKDLRMRLEDRARDLRAALAELSDTPKARHIEAKRRQKLAAILATVEKKLRDIKQMRLW